MKKQPKRTVKKQEEESIEAIFIECFLPVKKPIFNKGAIMIWSMCLGAIAVLLVQRFF